MSKLKELIDRYCPNGVEYCQIGEVCNILDAQRKPISKSKRVKGIYPYYGANGIQDYVADYIFDGTFLLVGEDGSVINKDNSPVLNWAVGKIWVNNHAHILTTKESNSLRYVYYALQIQDVSKIVRGTPPKINQENLKNIRIPLPPLPVQEEIVKILDRFAEYAAELQAELQARQEQYEYYRNKLLTFNEIGGGIQDVIWMKMSEIGTFIRGNGLQKKDFTESGIPCIHYGQIYTHYGTFATKTKSYVSSETAKKCKKAHCGDLVFATVSENIDDVCKCVAWLGNEEICISGDSLAFSHNQNPKYIAYYFQTYAFARYKRSRVTGAKVIRLHQSQLEQFEIPIPSLAEQARIVNILDKFERLVSDLVQGLPAEIAAVQEQYEYYRDKLLSFPEYKLSA